MSMLSITEQNGQHYYIHSCYTPDHGYETMVFPCDEKGNVTSWNELSAARYCTIDDMISGHHEMVKKWSD